MRALILAAGRGERLRPLTDRLPKPLVEVGGEALIERHVRRLAAAGIQELVINLAHLGEQIRARLGDGGSLGARIRYSEEPDGPLDSGGGMLRALPLLGQAPFAVVNADIWTDYAFERLPTEPKGLCHLVLVPHSEPRSGGDFALAGDPGPDRNAAVHNDGEHCHTFSGIGVYRPALFDGCRPGVFSVVPLIRAAAERGQVTGELYCGRWVDVGTPQRLAALRQAMGERQG